MVFDEADRLFEMGFGEQLNETLNRLPDSKQMVLFSATLPKMLVDFAKAGLNDPVLIRLGGCFLYRHHNLLFFYIFLFLKFL